MCIYTYIMSHPVFVDYPLLRQASGNYSGQAICLGYPLVCQVWGPNFVILYVDIEKHLLFN